MSFSGSRESRKRGLAIQTLSCIKNNSTYKKVNMVCWNAEVVFRQIIPSTCQIQSSYSQDGWACPCDYIPVSLTMTKFKEKFKEKFWVSRRQKLFKKMMKNCSGCKIFQVVALKTPPIAPLPSKITEWTTPFNMIGVNFADLVKYRCKRKKNVKCMRFCICVALLTECS